jgi:hypothetical protein
MVNNPGFLSYAITQWFAVVILCEIFVLAVLVRRELALQHPGVSLWLVASIVVNLTRLWAGLNSRTGYYEAFHKTQWIVEVAAVLLVVGVFLKCLWHFSSPVFLGMITVAALGGVSAAFAFQLAGEAVAGNWDVASGTTLARMGNFMLGSAVFQLLARSFFARRRHRCLSPNAKRAIDASTLLAAGTWANYVIALGGAPTRLVNALEIGLPMVCLILLLRMNGRGEDAGPPVEPDMPLSRYDAADQRVWDRIKRL